MEQTRKRLLLSQKNQFWTTMLWITAGCSLGNLKGTNFDRNSWGKKVHSELYSQSHNPSGLHNTLHTAFSRFHIYGFRGPVFQVWQEWLPILPESKVYSSLLCNTHMHTYKFRILRSYYLKFPIHLHLFLLVWDESWRAEAKDYSFIYPFIHSSTDSTNIWMLMVCQALYLALREDSEMC